MVTKTLGTLLVIVVCILLLPVTLGILGGLFGVVVGGIGLALSAVFDMIGWVFEGLFGWLWHGDLFDCNVFTIAAIILVVALLARSNGKNR